MGENIKIQKLNDLLDKIEGMNNCDFSTLQTLKNRCVMIISKIFGSDSQYIEALNSINFKPKYSLVTAGSLAHQEFSKRAFKEGQKVFKGLVTTMIEDLELSGPSLISNESVVEFISPVRIVELETLDNGEFDFTKLIELCRELNNNFILKNYLSVTMLSRAILDHVPPIFGHKEFKQVANNFGSKSVKKNLLNLENSMRNIADNYLHQTIRKKESLPTINQIDFKADMDVLLAEVIRLRKENVK